MVCYYSKDTPGAYEALEQAGLCATKCEHLMDGSVPFREIVDFEVMRSMLVRFKSDLMLTEGKIDPAIEMQNQSLLQLTKAVDHYSGNMDIHNAYVSCITRLQAVLVEHGRIARANEVTQAWLELAQRIRQTDESNPNTHEFLLLAYHTIGHLSEATQQVSQAQQHYHEALSIAKNILSGNPQSERLLAQVIELNVHLIGFDLRSDDLQSAQAHFEQAIEYASKLKSLPDKTDQYQSGIKNQLQTALRFLQDSAHNNKSDQWIARLRESELLQ
jgi:tetratricopeptide (TPR) repeat protein